MNIYQYGKLKYYSYRALIVSIYSFLLVFPCQAFTSTVGLATLYRTKCSKERGKAWIANTEPILEDCFQLQDSVGIYNRSRKRVIVASDRWERRPVPTVFDRSNRPDDLIFYEREENLYPNDELLAKLPEGETLINNDHLLNGSVQGSKYGTVSIVTTTDQNFDRALNISVEELPDIPYSYQITLKEDLEGKAAKGDRLLIKIAMRTLSGGLTEAQRGKIQLVVEETGKNGTFKKLLLEDVSAKDTWETFYFPVEYKEGYPKLSVRLGYYVQHVEIGGYEIINFKQQVALKDLPSSRMPEGFSKHAKWREEALKRIEQVRKGEFSVNVKDRNGKPIPHATVRLDMIEHDFEFGSAIAQHRGVLDDGDSRYKKTVQRLFNAAVLENNHKWGVYDAQAEHARAMVDTIKKIGLKYMRGHVLMWDRPYKPGISSAPIDILATFNNKQDIDAYVKNHIFGITQDFNSNINDWEVLNEFVTNTAIADVYGKQVVIDWFKWAREATQNENVTLYYNDYITDNRLFQLLDWMQDSKVDFDGIGIQSHFITAQDPVEIQDFFQKFEKYGKQLKITEYDFTTDDDMLQAQLTRDLLILAFSTQAMEGFYFWGFFNNSGGTRYPFYDQNWKEKPALDQYIDLVYNKWWTKEEGTTDNEGIFKLKGFYGDYDITVEANGKSKTISTSLSYSTNNDIIITLDTVVD